MPAVSSATLSTTPNYYVAGSVATGGVPLQAIDANIAIASWEEAQLCQTAGNNATVPSAFTNATALAQAVSNYASMSTFLLCGGSANAITLSANTLVVPSQTFASSFVLPNVIQNGMPFLFITTYANTSSVTVAITGLQSAIPLMQTVYSGTTITYSQVSVANTILAGQTLKIQYNATANSGSPAFVIQNGTASTQNTGTASGTIPMNGTSSATNTIAGVMQIATQAQVVAGTDNATAVSPYALQALPHYINPYSVTSANVDSNGYASFISSASSSSVTFNVTTPIVCCYPNGIIESNATLANVTGMSTNTTYYIYKIYGSAAVATTLQPVEAIVAPTSPSTGQLWLNIGVKPYIGYQWSGSAWTATNFVKLGQVTISGGVMGTPISYALNGQYISDIFSVGLSTNYDKSANIGSINLIIMLYFRENDSYLWQQMEGFITHNQSVGVIGASIGIVNSNTVRARTGDQAVSGRNSNLLGSASADFVTSGQYQMIVGRNF